MVCWVLPSEADLSPPGSTSVGLYYNGNSLRAPREGLCPGLEPLTSLEGHPYHLIGTALNAVPILASTTPSKSWLEP